MFEFGGAGDVCEGRVKFTQGYCLKTWNT